MADLSYYPFMWNVTMETTTTRFKFDTTKNPSPNSHTSQHSMMLLWWHSGRSSVASVPYTPDSRSVVCEFIALTTGLQLLLSRDENGSYTIFHVNLFSIQNILYYVNPRTFVETSRRKVKLNE